MSRAAVVRTNAVTLKSRRIGTRDAGVTVLHVVHVWQLQVHELQVPLPLVTRPSVTQGSTPVRGACSSVARACEVAVVRVRVRRRSPGSATVPDRRVPASPSARERGACVSAQHWGLARTHSVAHAHWPAFRCVRRHQHRFVVVPVQHRDDRCEGGTCVLGVGGGRESAALRTATGTGCTW